MPLVPSRSSPRADGSSQSRSPTTWCTARSARSTHRPTRPATAWLIAGPRAIRRRPGRRPGPPAGPARARAAARSRSRSTARISGRTGLPVTTARGRSVPGKETAAARAKRATRRLAAPGTAFCSATTIGMRKSTAARRTGHRLRSHRAPPPPPGDGAGRGSGLARRPRARPDERADVGEGEPALDAPPGKRREREAGVGDEAALDFPARCRRSGWSPRRDPGRPGPGRWRGRGAVWPAVPPPTIERPGGGRRVRHPDRGGPRSGARPWPAGSRPATSRRRRRTAAGRR